MDEWSYSSEAREPLSPASNALLIRFFMSKKRNMYSWSSLGPLMVIPFFDEVDVDVDDDAIQSVCVTLLSASFPKKDFNFSDCLNMLTQSENKIYTND